MKNSKEFDNLLNECLERVLRGEGIEQCLADHPEQAAELKPLLETAAQAKFIQTITPSADFKRRARYEFREAVHARATQQRKWSLVSWHPRWATVAIGVLIVILASGGTMAAASSSMPDDALYPVKLAGESVQLTLTASNIGKAQLHAEFADRRVVELVKMADKGKLDKVEQATERLDSQLQKVKGLALAKTKAAAPLPAPAPRVAPPVTATPVPSPARSSVPPMLAAPATPVPAPTPSPTQAPAPRIAIAPTPAQADSGVGAASGQAKTSANATAKSAAPKLDKRAIVKQNLAKAFATHRETLRALLARAPEPVKPAIRRAIAVSEADYREAIKALED